MENRTKMLVVDDEAQILRVIEQILAAHSYSVRCAVDGESGMRAFSDWSPDLVISDLQMPVLDGLTFCRRLRESSDVPIIILSVKDSETTIVDALEAGADDYVVKPFSANELVARIRASLRRRPPRSEEIFEAGDFRIDFARHRVEVRRNEIHLTPKEFDLLAVFARNPDRVLTHRILMNGIWGDYYSGATEPLRVLVRALRKKIEIDDAIPRYLLSEPWIGYRFVPGG